MHPELLVRAIRCASLELLAEYLEDEWLRCLLPLLGRQWNLEAEHSMLLRYRYTHRSERA